MGAGLLQGVLRRDHEEGLGQGSRLTLEGHLALGHGLQQRALGARRAAVDLVGEQHLGKNGSGMKAKAVVLAVVNGQAENIGGQQVGGELHALVREPQHLRQRVREGGFAHAGQIFDQQMSTREQAAQREAQLRLFAQQHAGHLFDGLIDLRPSAVLHGLNASAPPALKRETPAPGRVPPLAWHPPAPPAFK